MSGSGLRKPCRYKSRPRDAQSASLADVHDLLHLQFKKFLSSYTVKANANAYSSMSQPSGCIDKYSEKFLTTLRFSALAQISFSQIFESSPFRSVLRLLLQKSSSFSRYKKKLHDIKNKKSLAINLYISVFNVFFV